MTEIKQYDLEQGSGWDSGGAMLVEAVGGDWVTVVDYESMVDAKDTEIADLNAIIQISAAEAKALHDKYEEVLAEVQRLEGVNASLKSGEDLARKTGEQLRALTEKYKALSTLVEKYRNSFTDGIHDGTGPSGCKQCSMIREADALLNPKEAANGTK